MDLGRLRRYNWFGWIYITYDFCKLVKFFKLKIMEISSRHIGPTIIELSIEACGVTLTEDITDLNGKVDPQFIEDLRYLVDELKEHNDGI